jgi:hypothetical protein
MTIDTDDNDAWEQLMQRWARLGFLQDTGDRKWSDQTRRNEIVWLVTGRCHCGCDPDECRVRAACPYKHDQ